MNKPIDIEKANSSIKLGVIIKEIDNIKRMLNAIYHKIDSNQQNKDFRDMGVPSVIVDITPRQIYMMRKDGWTAEQICAISGYSLNEAKKKYDNHVKKNVESGR